MTKNISTKSIKSGHRAGNTKADKKASSQTTATTIANSQNATNHSSNEVANSAAVQKASIDSKMLTPEQRRLASLMNDKVDVSDIEKKISKIMELTGASKDKAIVALHDCANELDKAIDMILEGDSINESEWKSQTRKKKPKTGLQSGKETSDAKVQLNGQAKKLGKSAITAGNRQPLRNKQQQQTNKSERPPFVKKDRDLKPREQNNNDESTNNKEVNQQPQEEDDWQDAQSLNKSQQQQLNNRTTRPSSNENQFKSHKPSYLGDNRGKTGKDIRDGGQRGPYNSNRSSNTFGQGGDRSSNQRGERRTFQNKNYIRKPGERSQYNSIDTWTNNMTSTDTTNQTASTTDYAQMTVGNWSDVVSSTVQQKTSVINKQVSENLGTGETEEWVEPNKVFNKDNQSNSATINKDDHQIKMPNLASIVSGVKPTPQISSQQQQQQQQPTNLNKSLNQKQSINQLGSNATATSSQTSNHQMSTQQQTNLHKSSQQPQRSPQQQQQNKIDLAALLKSGSQQQPTSQQQPPSTQLTNQQTTSNLIKGNLQQQPQRTANENKGYGAAILQSLQQRPQNAGNESNKPGNLSDYVSSPYSNAQLSKNLVHNIPSNNYNSQNASSQLFDSHHLHHQNVNDQQTISDHHQKSLIDKSRRRQTKIPETAVEMPTSEHISSLNVQFGALDFGTDSYLNDNSEKQSASLLSTIRGDKQQPTPKDILHNQLDQHQQLPDNLLDTHTRNKPAGYQQKSTNSLYSNNQQQDSHPSIYQQNLQQYGYNSQTSNNQSNYSVNNYGSQNHNSHSNQNTNANQSSGNQQQTSGGQQTNQANNSQKINLKDLDISSSNSNSSTQINTATTLGLAASNTTVTTNVLKNSLTATGKSNMQQPNVPPLLGTPQYIMNMSQQVPGLSAFYPIMNYDAVPAMADHTFRYNQNSQDVKYNRTDANDGVGQSNPHNVQSTQAQVNQQQNHQIFSQLSQYPHPYGLFYTGFYPGTPFLPVQPNVNPSSNNQHANSNHSTNFPPKAGQNQQAYSSSYSSGAYDHALNAQIQSQQDYNKPQQNYGSGPTQAGGNQNQQTGGKPMSNAGGNDSNMYTKTHAQLTKNYDKPNFNQVQTPPPFGMTAMSYQNQYIPMLQPQSQPSMLHHTLQGSDANQSANNSGVSGNQRNSLSQQKQTSNAKSYYWN